MNLTLTNRHPSIRLPPAEWRRRIQTVLRVVPTLECIPRRFVLDDLSVVFLDDPDMAELNWQYLRHKGPTDVITFPYSPTQGEIFVSLDTAKKEAQLRKHPWIKELQLYLIHGILHLAGLGDKKPAERRVMRAAERMVMRKLTF